MFKDSSDKEQDKNIKLYEFLIHPFVGVRLITSLMLFYLLLNKLSSIDNLVNIWQATCKETNNKAKKSSQVHKNRFSWINGDFKKYFAMLLGLQAAVSTIIIFIKHLIEYTLNTPEIQEYFFFLKVRWWTLIFLIIRTQTISFKKLFKNHSPSI